MSSKPIKRGPCPFCEKRRDPFARCINTYCSSYIKVPGCECDPDGGEDDVCERCVRHITRLREKEGEERKKGPGTCKVCGADDRACIHRVGDGTYV